MATAWNSPLRAAFRAPRLVSTAPLGALVLAAAFLPGPRPLFGHGEADEALAAHFDEHLDEFEEEVRGLAVRIDALVATYAEGGEVADALEELIEGWERVEIHEVVEAKAIHLYPPIWQGIYAIERTAEGGGSAAEMARAGERLKGALWQSLGGLRALAALPDKGVSGGSAAQEARGRAGGLARAGNRIELTGDDDMRFNRKRFVVLAGEPVTLRFENVGELPKEVMGHNVVVLEPSADVEAFGRAAAQAAESDYIPTGGERAEEIVAHTALLGPGQSDTIEFTLEEPGAYPFLCSFTAHFRLMRGVIEAAPDPASRPVEAILWQLESALDAYAGGEPGEAERLVHAAYMNVFEGLEGDLIERDPDLVSRLELEFNAGLPALFQESAPVSEARAKLEEMGALLERAKALLAEAESERPSVF